MKRVPKLSIIVPVYRVEAYLSACINSILAQTFTDFELILVDDGSPDNCPALCDEAARKDPRIRVIHQKNGGLSAARNTGIEAARGAWLSFIDSDDFIAPEFYEILLGGGTLSLDADCAMCSVELVKENGIPFEPKRRLRVKESICTGKDALQTITWKEEQTAYIVVWNRVYKRKVFRTLRFPEGRVNEDDFVFAELYDTIDKLVCVDRPMYCYRQREGSIMNSRVTCRNLDQAWGFYQCFQYFLEHGKKDLLAPAEKRIFAKLVGVYCELSLEDQRSPEARAARKMQRDAVKCLFQNHCLSGQTLFRTLLFQTMPGIYGMRRKAYQRKHKIV